MKKKKTKKKTKKKKKKEKKKGEEGEEDEKMKKKPKTKTKREKEKKKKDARGGISEKSSLFEAPPPKGNRATALGSQKERTTRSSLRSRRSRTKNCLGSRAPPRRGH